MEKRRGPVLAETSSSIGRDVGDGDIGIDAP